MSSPLQPLALTPLFVNNLGSTPTQVMTGPGVLGAALLYNPNASVVYVQVWDVAAVGGVAEGTNPKFVLPIAATSGLQFVPPTGVNMGDGLVLAATTAPTGSTGPATALSGSFFVLQ